MKVTSIENASFLELLTLGEQIFLLKELLIWFQLCVGHLDGQGVVAEGVDVLPGLVPSLISTVYFLHSSWVPSI